MDCLVRVRVGAGCDEQHALAGIQYRPLPGGAYRARQKRRIVGRAALRGQLASLGGCPGIATGAFVSMDKVPPYERADRVPDRARVLHATPACRLGAGGGILITFVERLVYKPLDKAARVMRALQGDQCAANVFG